MSVDLNDGQVLGTCEHCGDEGFVFEDNSRCEQCDSDHYNCCFCDEDQHVDSLCRHLFRDENLEWRGSAVTKACGGEDGIKEPFLKLLGMMPEGFAERLRQAIKAGKFYTWLSAPIIGGGGLLSLYGVDGQEGKPFFYYGDALIAIGEGEDVEDIADAYHWLASLYKDTTAESNESTVEWIDEWSEAQRMSADSTKAGRTA